MNGGMVPLLLIGLSVGLMLAFAPKRTTMVALVAFGAAALLAYTIPAGVPATAIFVGLWGTVIAVAAATFLPVARWPAAMIALSVIVALWMGAYAALSGDYLGLALGLMLALVCYPAKYLVARNLDIVIKVVASWMIAIASLSMFVSLMPTPGYKPDHLE